MSTCLVTGANRGIGLALCRQLAARGDDVIAVCRQTSPEPVSYTHLTLPTICFKCRSRWGPYH